MSNISGSNISIGAKASGAFSELDKLRAKVKTVAYEVNSSLTGAFKAADAQSKMFRSGLTRLGDEILTLSKRAALVGTLPALLAAGQSYRDFAQMQMLQRGVERYGESLKDVRELAKLPNVGVFDGAKSLIALKAMRMESDLAKRSIKAFANAITDAGGSAADLDPALVNLRQFMSTKHINQVDLRQLANRIPQTMEALQNAFGTTDPEALNKLGIDKFIRGFVSELEKIPPVAGGAQMSMDQFLDSLTFAKATLGEGLDTAYGISSGIAGLGDILDSLTTRFRELSPEAQKSVIQLGGLVALLPVLTAGLGAAVKYLPMLAGSLGVTWPVAAILATVAGITSLVAVLNVAKDKSGQLAIQVEDLNRKISETENASAKVVPLIEKYEELKEKAAKGADVQEDLRKVIDEIAQLVPSAATGFDKFGNALDINTEKARANNEEQKKLLATLKAMSVEAQKSQVALKTLRVQELQNQMNSGSVSQKVHLGMGIYGNQTYKMSAEDYRKAAAEMKRLNTEIATIQGSIGNASSEAFTRMGGEARLETETKALDKLKKAYEDADKAYAAANRRAASSKENWQGTTAAVKELEAASKARDAAYKQLAQQQSLVGTLSGLRADSGLKADSPAKVVEKVEPAFNIATSSIKKLEERVKGLREEFDALDPTTAGYAQRKRELIKEINTAEARIKSERSAIDSNTKSYGAALKTIKDYSAARTEIYAIDKVNTWYKERDAIKAATDEYKKYHGSILTGVKLENVYRKEVAESRTQLGNRLKMSLLGRLKNFQRPDWSDSNWESSNAEALRRVSEFGGDSNVFKGLTDDAKTFINSLNTDELTRFFGAISEGSKESAKDFSKAINNNVESIKSLGEALTEISRRGLAEGFITMGEALANSISQVGTKAGDSFKMLMGNLLQEIGKALIIYNNIMKAVKVALQNGGWGAIAAGVLAITAGQLLKNSVTKSQNKAASGMRRFANGALAYREMQAIVGDNRNARFNPEVIAPLDKLQGMIHNSMKKMGGAHQNVRVEVVGVIDNNVIRLANANAVQRNNRLRGS